MEAFAFLGRRKFLKLGVAGLGVVGAGALGLASSLRWLRGTAPSIDGLRVLSPARYRTMANIARAQFPAGGPFAAGADDLELARAFDGFLADEGPENQSDLETALDLVEYGPVIFDHRAVTFSNLGDDDKITHWRSWCESDALLRRQVATAFRKFILLVGFDDSKTWAGIGYAGPSLWGMPT